MRNWAFLLSSAVLCSAQPAFPQLSPDSPRVGGIVLAAQAVTITPAREKTERVLVPGDLGFPEDTITVAAGGSLDWLDCRTTARYVIRVPGSLVVGKSIGMQAERKAFVSAFCGSLSADPAPDSGIQHFRKLLREELSNPDRCPQPVASHDRDETIISRVANDFPDSIEDPQIPVLNRAVALEAAGQLSAAREEYTRLRSPWSQVGWLEHKIADLDVRGTLKLAYAAGNNLRRAAALVVGISQFLPGPEPADKSGSKFKPLLYAANDARLFDCYLRSIGISAQQPILDQAATQARIAASLATLGCSLKERGVGVVFISSHGIRDANGRDYIVPYDGDRGYPELGGIPVDQIGWALGPFVRGYAFVDACRTRDETLRPKLAGLSGIHPGAAGDHKRYLLYAAEPGQASVQPQARRPLSGKLACPGVAPSGVFAHGLVDLLAFYPRPRAISRRTLKQQLDSRVSNDNPGQSLEEQPQPAQIGLDDPLEPLVPAFSQVSYTPRPPRLAGDSHPPWLPFLRPAAFFQAPSQAEIRFLERLLRPDEVSPAELDAAEPVLARIRDDRDLQPTLAGVRIALEEAGQRIIHRYLQGDEIPPQRSDYIAGERFYRLASVLFPGSLLYRARIDFLRARTRLFDLRDSDSLEERRRIFDRDVLPVLDNAQRLDLAAAYTLNAKGIGYLESGRYEEARKAFEDAVQRQPRWAYPMHNLALTYLQQGRSRDSVRTYARAIEQAPNYSYLHFNLALVYQRLNRRREADRSYRRAGEIIETLDPGNARLAKEAQLYNAWGTLRALENRPGQAKDFYQRAQKAWPAFLEPLHNLAMLEKGPKRVALLRDVVSSHAYRPSRFELARELLAEGSNPALREAVSQLEAIVNDKPNFTSAHLHLADAHRLLGDFPAAVASAQQAGRISSLDWQPDLALARAYSSWKQTREAIAARDQALQKAGRNRSARKEIQRTWNKP